MIWFFGCFLDLLPLLSSVYKFCLICLFLVEYSPYEMKLAPKIERDYKPDADDPDTEPDIVTESEDDSDDDADIVTESKADSKVE